MKLISMISAMCVFGILSVQAQFESDVIETDHGELEITFIGHGTLMFKYNQKVIHVDPTMQEADYATLPDADLILVTHQHGDHLDLAAINLLMKEHTRVVMPQACRVQLENFNATVMANGDKLTIMAVGITAIPAYNIKHLRSDGEAYHPKGEGNGYLLSFGSTHVLIGGDTENIPEYKDLNLPITVAFLPMNLPYTMTPGMVADAALTLRPQILYPYHYGPTDPHELVKLLKDEKGIEVRIRDLR